MPPCDMISLAKMQRVVISEKGREKFVENGTTFSFERSSADGQTQFWKCDVRLSCKARLHIRGGIVIKRINDHTHPGNAAKVEILAALTDLREIAANTQDHTAQVVAASVENLSHAAQAVLPAIRNLKRTILRQRVAVAAAPPNPLNLTDLVIPIDYTRYEKHPGVFEDFLLFDILRRSSEWFMDGTFDSAPALFAQVYSIHATYLGRTHPLVFGLLPNKRRDTYQALFTELNNLAHGDLNPTRIMTDFELAVIQASQLVFPNSENSGCFFHFSQNIHRRIKQAGLAHLYNNDANFALKCKMISALAYVPPQDVIEAFEELSEFLPNALQPVLDYIEDNYIGRPGRRGVRRVPTFPIALWNVYERAQNGDARTTNSVVRGNL